MWTYKHTLETEAGASAIFDLYRDVSGWPAWDAALESAKLDGAFAPGSTGTIVVKGQGSFGLRLLAVEERRRFEDETEIPDAGVVVRFDHLLEALAGGGTRVTHIVTIDGPAAEKMGPILGPGITEDTPEAMHALVAMASLRPVQR